MKKKEFIIFAPWHNQYISEEWGSLTPWQKEARSFPSMKKANNYIESHGWTNTTKATRYDNAYVVELIN